MSPAELAEWREYEAVEPWGDHRADLRMGIMASLYANAHRRKGARPFAPADFMPFAPKPKAEAQPSVSADDRIKMAFAAFPRKEKG